MHRHEHHPGHGHRHHHSDCSHEQHHYDSAWPLHDVEYHRASGADRAFAAGTLVEPGHSSVDLLLPLTPELSYSGHVTPSPASEGCPRTGGSGQCLGDCRACPNQAL